MIDGHHHIFDEFHQIYLSELEEIINPNIMNVLDNFYPVQSILIR